MKVLAQMEIFFDQALREWGLKTDAWALALAEERDTLLLKPAWTREPAVAIAAVQKAERAAKAAHQLFTNPRRGTSFELQIELVACHCGCGLVAKGKPTVSLAVGQA